MTVHPLSLRVSPDSTILGFAAAALSRITPRFTVAAATIGALLWFLCSTQWNTSYARDMEEWLSTFVLSTAMTMCMTLALIAADEAVDRGAGRFATYATAILIGAALGAFLEVVALRALGLPIWPRNTEQFRRWDPYLQAVLTFIQAVNFGGLAVFVYANLRASTAAARARNAAELERVRVRRQTVESQLQAMQARVEPQFLLNTLAQVRAIYEDQPQRAAAMLDDLITYLRAALPQLRESSSTLEREIELTRAYVDIMRMRIGEPLSLVVGPHQTSVGSRFPPMLLLPLVEHALSFGPAAMAATRTLTLAANVAGGRLTTTVTDSANAFANDTDDEQPALLKQIGERIASMYGDAGQFHMTRLADGRSRATLEVPHEIANDDHR